MFAINYKIIFSNFLLEASNSKSIRLRLRRTLILSILFSARRQAGLNIGQSILYREKKMNKILNSTRVRRNEDDLKIMSRDTKKHPLIY